MTRQTATQLAIAAALLAVLAAATGRAAEGAATKTVVDPVRQTVGSLKLGDPALKFSFAWGPASWGQPSVAGAVPESLQMWRLGGALPWAIVTFDADDQQHATAILYRRPFRTPRGDTNGTSLALVEKHWPHHDSPQHYLPSPSTPPAYTRMKIEGSYFYFNAKSQLVVIQVGDGTAGQWMNVKR